MTRPAISDAKRSAVHRSAEVGVNGISITLAATIAARWLLVSRPPAFHHRLIGRGQLLGLGEHALALRLHGLIPRRAESVMPLSREVRGELPAHRHPSAALARRRPVDGKMGCQHRFARATFDAAHHENHLATPVYVISHSSIIQM